MLPIEPDYKVLHFIREGKPLVWDQLVQLWYRVQNYEVLETIVDIAMTEQMPLWAAEEQYKRQWLEYRQTNWH